MSMYSLLFGTNPFSDYLLEMLNLDRKKVGRFRDCWAGRANDEPVIHVFTRNGGGNREAYQWVFDSLRQHPNYLCDYDDEFDSTYASIVFRIPERVDPSVREALAESIVDPPPVRMRRLLDKIQGGRFGDPDVKAAVEILRPHAEVIAKHVRDGKGMVVVDED